MGKKCGRCGSELIPSTSKGYDYQCVHCDEDFYEFERFVVDEDDNSISEIVERIKYLEDKADHCACSKDDLYEYHELLDELDWLENGGNE